MVTENNFDWSVTERPLVVFMPNWGRGNYIRKTVAAIKTEIPRDQWIVLVANDGVHEDLSDLKDQNVVYFTFQRPNISERNGCFIRNFVLRRLRSAFVFSKDPEIIVVGDFIKRILEDCDRPLYRLGGAAFKADREVTNRFMANDATIDDCIAHSQRLPIMPEQHMIMHYGYSMPVKILQQIRGYDEDYSISPYCEDRDLFYRLKAMNIRPFVDQSCFPVHLWHEMKFFPNTPENSARYERAKALFRSKDPSQAMRNDNDWGTGRPDLGSFDEIA